MRLQVKLLFSLIKCVGCFLFVCLIPIAMYAPTYFDFVNVSVIYLPFVGIVLFADIAILDKGSGTEEIAYLANKSPTKIFLQRYFLTLTGLLAYIILANLVFRVMQHFAARAMMEPISSFDYIAIAGGGCLLIGTLAMTTSAILKNVYIG